MTVHVHLERIVVDGPLPSAPHLWRAALERELAAALEAGPAGRESGWPSGGARLASLPASYVPGAEPAPGGVSPQAVGAAVGAALTSSGGGRR